MPQTQSKFSSRGALALSCLRSDRQALVLIKGVDSVFPEKYVRACVYVLSCVNIIYICTCVRMYRNKRQAYLVMLYKTELNNKIIDTSYFIIVVFSKLISFVLGLF